jgi:hypothetical protein
MIVLQLTLGGERTFALAPAGGVGNGQLTFLAVTEAPEASQSSQFSRAAAKRL